MSTPHKTHKDAALPPEPATPEPPLSKADRKRLTLYLGPSCNEDPHALARACGMDLWDILDWLDSPPIRRALALHDRARARAEAAARRRADAQAAPLRAVCLLQLREALERAMEDGRSQTSLRRAATALLRALAAADPASLHIATHPKFIGVRNDTLRHAGQAPPTQPPPPPATPSSADAPVSPSPSPSPSPETPLPVEAASADTPSPQPPPQSPPPSPTTTPNDPLANLRRTLAALERIRGTPLDIPPEVLDRITADLTGPTEDPSLAPLRQAG